MEFLVFIFDIILRLDRWKFSSRYVKWMLNEVYIYGRVVFYVGGYFFFFRIFNMVYFKFDYVVAILIRFLVIGEC